MRRQNSGDDAAEELPLAVEEPEVPMTAAIASSPAKVNPNLFRRRLMAWYRLNARPLPWRNTSDPYHIWVSEIMLQQTRVAAVIEHYHDFLRRFPTLIALALAAEADVLAAWSGLGYYRRARMLHKAAQFLMLERGGSFPGTSTELRTLPGIGEYTAAAIGSIAFGESIAVVDGNVERVLLRLTGLGGSGESLKSAQMRGFIRAQAQALVPARYVRSSADELLDQAPLSRGKGWTASERVAIAAAAQPDAAAASSAPYVPHSTNAAGDHNQAMMELGATICLPRSPLCLECPVYALCNTRGEHAVSPRPQQLSRPVAYLLDVRKRGSANEVLLERRAEDVSLMPGMFELPLLPLESVGDREPVLRVRHSITNTNYYVQVYSTQSTEQKGAVRRTRASALRRAVSSDSRDLRWVRTSHLGSFPLTGLARKVLQRLDVMEPARIHVLD